MVTAGQGDPPVHGASTIGRLPHGWYVDDIRALACAADGILAHGCELPPPP